MAPNAAGMALHAQTEPLLTKPYPASGNYVDTMSDHCGRCFYDPHTKHGERACPVTALYWDFLDRHREDLATNRRMRNQLRTLQRIDLDAVRARAATAREELEG